MSSPWIARHSPKNIKDIKGQDEAVDALRGFLGIYRSQKKRSALAWGPPGTGKTSAVHAAASTLGLEVLELNAGDLRNKEAITGILGSATQQMPLFAKSKMILIDDVDGLSGTKDRGGLSTALSISQKSRFPVVFTALDAFNQKLSGLRSKSLLIEFRPLPYTTIFERLREICDLESVSYEEIALKSLARRAGGDMRAAINDLQTASRGTGRLETKDLEMLGDREQAETVQNALLKIFKSREPSVVLSSLDNVSQDYSKTMLWIDENLPKEYLDAESLALAYDCLSKADVYSGRIRRWQHWRFLVYINALITAGVALSKKERNREAVSYTNTKRILKIWIANQRYAKRRSVAAKVARKTHTSSRRVMEATLEYLGKALRSKDGKAIAEWLELGPDEAEWARKLG